MKKTTRKQLRTLRRRRLALALVGAMAMPAAALAQDLPQNGTVTWGTATIGQNGNQMTITQTTKGAVIDWGSFSIGNSYGVTFNQQFGNTSVTLNRDSGSSPSYINGNLIANGSVFIINPSGIVFGSGAQVNVGGLVASTINIGNTEFIAGVSSGVYVFDQVVSAARLSNIGAITAQDKVVLIGGSVDNFGDILAGSAVLASGEKLTIDLYGDGLTQVQLEGHGIRDLDASMEGDAAAGRLYNAGTIEVGEDAVFLTDAIGGMGGGIYNLGSIEAGTSVWMRSSGGTVANGGWTQDVGIDIDSGDEVLLVSSFFKGHIRAPRIDIAALDVVNPGWIAARGGNITILADGGFYNTNPGLRALDVSSDDGEGGDITIRGSEVAFDAGNSHASLVVRRDFHDCGIVNCDPGGTDPGFPPLPVDPIDPTGLKHVSTIEASGLLGGGSIDVLAYDFLTVAGQSFGAGAWDAAAGDGGSIKLVSNGRAEVNAGVLHSVKESDEWLATGGLWAAGLNGGHIETSANWSLDIWDTEVNASGGGWDIRAGNVNIFHRVGSGDPSFGAGIADDVLGLALNHGESVSVFATSGDIGIAEDVNIAADGAMPSSISLNAWNGSIIGSGFTIQADSLRVDFLARNGIYIYGARLLNNGDKTFNAGSISLEAVDLAGGGFMTFNGSAIDISDSNLFGSMMLNAGAGIDISDSNLFGSIMLNAAAGIDISSSRLSGGGDILIRGTNSDPGGVGVSLFDTEISGGAGAVTVEGMAETGTGVSFDGATSITTTSGDISIISTGLTGLITSAISFSTQTGSIHLEGHAQDGVGVFVGGGLTTNGGDIEIIGDTASDAPLGALGVLISSGDIQTNGGAITIIGDGGNQGGVQVIESNLESGGGDISIEGSIGVSFPYVNSGVLLHRSTIHSAGGNLFVTGSGVGDGPGVQVTNSEVTTSGGDIQIEGDGAASVTIYSSQLLSEGGNITIFGRGQEVNGVWLISGQGSTLISSEGGDITISGTSDEGAGIEFWGMDTDAEVMVDAGNGLVTLRASNNGTGKRAIEMVGYVGITSSEGVVLTPYDTDSVITVGDGSGFSLTAADLANINTPQLIIGSSQHAGAIHVVDGIDYEGNLTLQNQGASSGGISIEAALDVGDHVLALASGGGIAQTAAGVITARSLLALAGGSVALGAAQNHVSGNTLAGSAAGGFGFLNDDALAIGTVGAFGFDSTTNALQSMSAAGISAGGDVRVQNVDGNLTLLADISGRNIDLLTGGTLQNTAQVSLNATGNWRVWADTWEGEERGGLNGGGALPNLYNCTADGECGAIAWAASTTENHFIYRAQPVATIGFVDATREYGLNNPVFTWTLVSGGQLGDTLAAITGTGGAISTNAAVGSSVGQYQIMGSGWVSPAGYRLVLNPGWLTITPATLLFTATPTLRIFGDSMGDFEGTITGLRNGDTMQWLLQNGLSLGTNATSTSLPGWYAILAGGNLQNYVIQQAQQNQTALQIIPKATIPPPPPPPPPPLPGHICAVDGDGALHASGAGDDLGRQWILVRDSQRLNSCLDSKGKSSCKID